VTARLHPDDLAALADLVADRLAGRLLSARPDAGAVVRPAEAVACPEALREEPPALLAAREVAARFGVSAEWVRDHQEELGVVRLGDGPRPRLRFDPERVADALTRRSASGTSERSGTPAATGDRPRRHRSGAGNGLDSLPVRELQPRPTSRNVAGRRANAPGPATRDVSSPRPEPTPAGRSSAVAARPRKEA
jgi:hypothetical protein